MVQNQARAVIVGSGIAGSSIAYHLTELGWRDIVVLEQGPLIGGTTSHAPGLVGQLRSSVTLAKLLMYSVSLYRKLRVNNAPGFFEVGSLRLASSKERMEELKRQAGFARGIGLDAQLVVPGEVKRLVPILNLKGVEGALYLRSDGSARAPILAQAMADEARRRGAVFYPETPVSGLEVNGGRIRAVLTPKGRILTEIVVGAAGIWSPRMGRMAGISIPLVPMEHQYVMSGPIQELAGQATLPNVRDPDHLVYFRQDGDSLVLGGYEREPSPCEVESIRSGVNPTVVPFHPERFEGLWAAGEELVPALRGARRAKEVCGLESFTPDGEFILGESPDVRGLWVACGFCAHGVAGSGGVGKAIAEWIVEGEPSLEMWHMDVRRFTPFSASHRYRIERASEVYGTYYDITYPGHEKSTARKLRLSPLYSRLENLGAVFGEKSGWERPNWFTSNEGLARGKDWPRPRGWASRHWSPAIGSEHAATRDRVAIYDETSFSKMEVVGPGSLSFLQWITTNEMDKPVGSITYTQLLNRRGGIECDLTVTRLDACRFQIITGTAFGVHDSAWIRRHMPVDGSVAVRDITSSLCCLGVWGPLARELISKVSENDFSNAAFPYLTAQEATIEEVPVLACRVTYVGELGWEIYAPVECGLKVWDTLWEAGKPLGLVAGGYRAIDSLRLEKGYRYWSADIHSEYNPFEAGLRFSVKMEKGDFLGREALKRIKAEGVRRKLCCLTLDDPSAMALGGEPLMTSDGVNGDAVLGRVTSGGYGYTVRQSIAYGYLPTEYSSPGTIVEVELFGERHKATVMKEPLYDPKNEKVKS